MALIPGKTINGKFKTFQEMTTEELEEVAVDSTFKKYIIILFSVVFITIVLVTLSSQ